MQIHRSFISRSLVLFAAALLTSTVGCEADDAAETSIEEVRDFPAAYHGKIISAVGKVKHIYPSGAFTLDGKGTWWNDDILVVVPREQAVVFERGAEVRVTGEVQDLVVAEVERDYDLDFEPELEVKFRDEPILIARNLVVLEKQ